MNTSKAFRTVLTGVAATAIIVAAPPAGALPAAPTDCSWNILTGDVDLGCVGLGPAAKPTPKPTAQPPAPSASLLLPCLETAPAPGQKCDAP